MNIRREDVFEGGGLEKEREKMKMKTMKEIKRTFQPKVTSQYGHNFKDSGNLILSSKSHKTKNK